MSTEYKITPLHLGDITRPKSNMIYGYNGKEIMDFPIIAYYIEGKYKILVDTGGASPESEQGKKAAPYKRTPEQELDAALRNIGVSTGDVEYVVLTHLHWDHAGNNHLFPDAKFLCQKIEYDSFTNPGFDKLGYGYDTDYLLRFNYELIDGDKELFDGISAILTPGHTLGMQSVVIDTKIGKVVLSGDLVTLRESLSYDQPRFNAMLYNDSAAEIAQTSLDKVLAVSKHVLPGHDPNVFSPNMGLFDI